MLFHESLVFVGGVLSIGALFGEREGGGCSKKKACVSLDDILLCLVVRKHNLKVILLCLFVVCIFESVMCVGVSEGCCAIVLTCLHI